MILFVCKRGAFNEFDCFLNCFPDSGKTESQHGASQGETSPFLL